MTLWRKATYRRSRLEPAWCDGLLLAAIAAAHEFPPRIVVAGPVIGIAEFAGFLVLVFTYIGAAPFAPAASFIEYNIASHGCPPGRSFWNATGAAMFHRKTITVLAAGNSIVRFPAVGKDCQRSPVVKPSMFS